MKADIKYTVRHHSLPVRNITNVLFGFGGLIILLLDLVWVPFKGLTPELQAFAIIYIIPDIFWDMHVIALMSIALGFVFRPLRWRTGKIELTDEKLIVAGSYYVSIWLKNMWEVDFRDKWKIRLDSNVDAVEIKFKTENEFVEFSDKLIKLVAPTESVKFNTAN
jgi:hypothetical protein